MPGRSWSSSLLSRFLKGEGYRTKLVINVTDINDKIYDAARPSERALRRVRERE